MKVIRCICGNILTITDRGTRCRQCVIALHVTSERKHS